MHYNTLNIDYHKGVLEGWRKGGCMVEIERRLGYRFRLLESEATAATAPGGPVHMTFTVANDGFGNLYNKRPLELVLRPRASGKSVRLKTGEDARRWMPGRITTVRLQVRLPKTITPGEYDVFLALPDAAPTLSQRTEYAVRLANADAWEPATGLNRLGHIVRVR